MKIAPKGRMSQKLLILVVMAAVLFNPMFAIINNYAIQVSRSHIMVMEITLLVFAAAIAASEFKYDKTKEYTIIVIFVFMLTTNVVFLFNQHVDMKSVRDFLIVIVFWQLGKTISRDAYFSIMRYASIVVLFFAVIEVTLPTFYMETINPAGYYLSTRGIEADVEGASGFYKSADGYAGRFTINFLSDHRLSSLFMEPVSFGNFVIIGLIFCISYWPFLSKWDRFVYISLFVIGSIGSDSRTAVIISLAVLLYLPFCRHISEKLAASYVPLIFALSIVLSAVMDVSFFSDSFSGRAAWSGYLFMNSQLTDLFVGNTSFIGQMNIPDAGYFYIIISHTLFGLILLVGMFSIYPKKISANDRLLVHGLVLFFAIKMLISSSLFSLKISPFLWIGIGFVVSGGMKRYLDRFENAGGQLGRTPRFSSRNRGGTALSSFRR